MTIDPDKAYVYILHIADDYYKIGWSGNPKQRANGLGLSNKSIVHLIESFDPRWAEMTLHALLSDYCVPLDELPSNILTKVQGGLCEIFKLNDNQLSNLKCIEKLSLVDLLEMMPPGISHNDPTN